MPKHSTVTLSRNSRKLDYFAYIRKIVTMIQNPNTQSGVSFSNTFSDKVWIPRAMYFYILRLKLRMFKF